jgi:hypothetical protein
MTKTQSSVQISSVTDFKSAFKKIPLYLSIFVYVCMYVCLSALFMSLVLIVFYVIVVGSFCMYSFYDNIIPMLQSKHNIQSTPQILRNYYLNL